MTDLARRLLRDGYRALELERRDRGHAATYATRLLGRRAVVLGGADGARLFYDEALVQRSGAVPPPLAWLLFGRGAVHGLDDHAHRTRRALLASQLEPGRVAGCAALLELDLVDLLAQARGRTVAAHDLLVRALGRSVLTWAGVPLDAADPDRLARAYASIVDGFGFAPAAYARAWRARLRTDAWARGLIDDVRHGRVLPPPATPLAALAHSDLDTRLAAVELGNLLRPTVAVSWLATFAIRALSRMDLPDEEADAWRRRLAAGDQDTGLAFAQEVRRTTPFVPALAGRVRREVVHDGVRLEPGTTVVLDVREIDLDPALHPDPLRFRPDRFLGHLPGAYDLVPQGGGPSTGHRCPGESLTLQLLAAIAGIFARTPHRVVGDDAVDLRRIPTLPADGLQVAVMGTPR